jgi:transcriptional regulator with XRE-family HTH domain
VKTRLSPAQVGRNLQELRTRRGFSQAEVAAKAKISERTLRRAEAGFPVRDETIVRICEALTWSFEEATTSVRYLQARDEATPFRVHAPQDTVWYATEDRRKMRPDDDHQRIQDPAERHRLGSLGLVAMFIGTLQFSMPEGPGIAFFEVYGPVQFGGHQASYHELFLYCLRGEVTFTVAGRRIRVVEGGALNVGTDRVGLEPTHPVGEHDLAPIVMHVGANIIRGPSPNGSASEP